MKKLRIDFFESGKGDTIVVTFPKGGVGVIDAHPSRSKSRPNLLSIVGNRDVHFVCLTHPHADHGVDLPPLLRRGKKPAQFWHTTSDINAFVYRLTEFRNFRHLSADLARELKSDWAKYHIEIFGAVREQKIAEKRLQGDLQHETIDGVAIHFLSPEQRHHQEVLEYWLSKAEDQAATLLDLNRLSAVIALQFGGRVVLLGADALQENWEDIAPRMKKQALPKAVILKVPHHGAKNAFGLGEKKKRKTYLRLCRSAKEGGCYGVLFSGDANHPDKTVYKKLDARMSMFCTFNGLSPQPAANPLGIKVPGARLAGSLPLCNAHIAFEIDETGATRVISGTECRSCPNRPR